MTSPTRQGEPPVLQPTNESPLPAAEKGTKVRWARHLSQEQDLRGTRNWVIKMSSISVQYLFINMKNTQWTQNRILKTHRMRITDISLASGSTMAYTTLLLILCSFKTWYLGLPWWCNGWESACQCRGHGFEPWSGKIPHAAEQLGPWATTTEPARLEPVLRNRRGHDRGPRTAMKSGPHSPQLEKALAQKWRPNTAKNK